MEVDVAVVEEVVLLLLVAAETTETTVPATARKHMKRRITDDAIMLFRDCNSVTSSIWLQSKRFVCH